MKKTLVSEFWGKLSIETRWFVVLALLFGSIFVVTCPPKTGADEGNHFARVWKITTGEIFAEKDTLQKGVYGGWIPANLMEINSELPSRRVRGWVYFPNTAAHSPVAYTPNLLAVSLARLFHASVFTTFYLSRFFNLLFFILGIAFALHALRGSRAQWVVFVLALLPSTLFQASIITADTTTHTLTILFSALLLKSLFLNKILSRRESIIFLVCAALIPILKQSYAPLSLLIFLVPITNLAVRRPRLGQILTLLIGFGLFIFWSVAIRDVANYNGAVLLGENASQVAPSEQIHFILHHPLDMLNIACNTLLTNGQFYMVDFFGNLGMPKFGRGVPAIRLPAISMSLCIFMLGLAVLVFEKPKLSRRYSLIILADILIGVLMLFAILYLVFTPVGSNIVNGINGRYFIPFIILTLSAISALMPQLKPDDSRWHEAVPKLFLYGTAISLSLAAFKLIYFVVAAN